MIQDLSFIFDSAIYNSIGLSLVALGVLVSIRFTGYPDLTVDGSFTIGAAIFAVSVGHNIPIPIAIILSFLSGVISGALTATVNDFMKIGKIVSAIIVMLFLITLSPYLTGGSTLGLLHSGNIFESLDSYDKVLTNKLFPNASFSLHLTFNLVLLVFICIIALLISWFFNSKTGIRIRYIGSSEEPELIKKRSRSILLFLGLALGNALVGIGGAIEAHRNGGFSQNMGLGITLIAITILVLGESIVKIRLKRDNLTVNENLFAVALGTFFYSFALQCLLAIGITFIDVRLTTTFLLLVLLTTASRYFPNSTKFF